MTSHQVLFNFVFEKLENSSPSKRIQVLRALADFAGGRAETNELLATADDLERSENRLREFLFRQLQRVPVIRK